MKFKMISEKDVEAIQAAKRVITRIVRRAKRLHEREKALYDAGDKKKWRKASDKSLGIKAEMRALDMSVILDFGNGDEKLVTRLLPSGKLREGFALL